MSFIEAAAGTAFLSLAAHVASVSLASYRCAWARSRVPQSTPPISIVQPHRGLENFSDDTVESLFFLHYPVYEILFCVVSETDPIVPLLRRHIEAHPERAARILVGDAPISGNPKLNNLIKGWKAAQYEWVVLADSNVLAPPDYLTRLMSRQREDTGIVCSPPIGARPQGFAAHWECAFLNTYQARWQYAAELLGFGFAQGKTMFWRKSLLDDNGGVEALAGEIAEDAAATKLVRGLDREPHLVEGPFPQPLGSRKWADVWKRQVRWARMRRATFALFFLPEIFTTALLPIACAALAAPFLHIAPIFVGLVAAVVWYGAEALLAYFSGWPLGLWSLPAWILRDFALPLIWFEGISGDSYEWRGNRLSVDNVETAPLTQ